MSNIFKFRQPPPGFVTEYYGGGKSSTSTQTVSIPPEVMARYNAVNARAEDVAATPFQQYGGQFVAGLTPTQQAGIQATNVGSQTAQPYYGLGAAYTMSGAQDVGPLTKGQIGYYQDPAMLATLAPTAAALRQQQGQQLSQQQADAIKAGAFGGSRYDLARAQLMGQQQLGMGQALAPIYQKAYETGLGTAQQQQGVVASDLARRMQAGQQIAGLGTGAQQAALQGAQAQIAAGTTEQQTQQADLTARYQQFLQERGYPFQVAQFLANIAMGTGALSGSTTTTTQPTGFFSDKRLKHDAHRIGETDDGIPIYSFKYNGDDKTQIGLMAQDVEKRKPEAVGLAPAADGKMYKTVDYEKATRRGRDAGGLIPSDMDANSMGGAVDFGVAGEGFAQGGYAYGGGLIDEDYGRKLVQNQITGPYGQGAGVTGKSGIPYGGLSYVPQASLPVAKLVTAGNLPAQQKSGLAQTAEMGKSMQGTYQMGKGLLVGSAPTKDDPEGSSGILGGQGKLSGKNVFQEAKDWLNKPEEGKAHGGLIIGRHHYDDGGLTPGQEDQEEDKQGAVNPAGVPSSGFAPGVLESGKQHAELAVAKGGPGGGGGGGLGSGLKDAASLLSAGKGLYEGGKWLSTLLFAADGGRINPYAYGGLIPREHHADGEEVGDKPVSLFERPAEPAQPAPERGLAVREAPRQEAPNYRNIVIESAKKHGIDPEHAVRLAQGESGLRPISGDEGSSGSIFQLHVGGLSRQYPNSGLGDVYFQQRRPDLVKLTPQEKIAYLNDPRNQADIADFSAEHISKHGARPWTVARNQGLFGLGEPKPETGSARRPGVIDQPMYSGTPARQASLGDVAGEVLPKSIPTESSFWVPALGFLGSMLASQRTTLGGALGEGLIGGVSAYQADKKQQMELARDLRGMFDERFVQGTIPNDPAKYGDMAGKPGFWDKKAQNWLTPDQVNDGKRSMAQELGIPPSYLGVPRAPTRPLTPVEAQRQQQEGAQPSATTQATQPATTTATEPAKAAPSPQQRQEQVAQIAGTANPDDVYQMEPAQLINRIKEGGPAAYEAAGLKGTNDPRPLEQELTGIRQRIRDLEATGRPDVAQELNTLRATAADLDKRIGDKYQLGIARQLELNKKDAEVQMMEYKDYRNELSKRQQEYKVLRPALVSLGKLYADYESGRASNIKADIQSWADQFGLGGLLRNAAPGFDAAKNDEAVKMAFKLAFKQVSDSSTVRAPAAALREANLTVPEPTRAPGAVYAMIADRLAEMDFVHDRDRAFMASKSRDPVGWNYNFENKTAMEPYKAAAFSEIPPSKGIPEEEVRKFVERHKFIPYGVDPESIGEVRYLNDNIGIVRRVDPQTNKAQFYYFKRGRE